MDKYEYRIKTEQMLEYMENKSYKEAMEVADSIDWRRVKNAAMLCVASEVYEYNGEYQKSRDILFAAYDRSPGSRKIVYRLGTLALKLNDTKEATECYEEFIAMAPKDPNQYILRYKILKAQEASAVQKIEALEEFKKAEYVEKWAYELAKLYDEAGMVAECLEECDDLILWFSEGKYVFEAMELKMKYKPLTPLQQEKYIHRNDKVEIFEKEVSSEEVSNEEVSQENASEEVAEEVQKTEEAAEETAEVSEEEAAAKSAAIAEALAAGESVAAQTATVGEVIDAVENMPVEEETKEADEEQEEKKEREQPSVPSIEEILQGWEEKQKENAQIIQAEQEKVQIEREERALERKDAEIDSILPDDIRQLMEELEAEASERKAMKANAEQTETPAAGEVVENPVSEQEEVLAEEQEAFEETEEYVEEEYLELEEETIDEEKAAAFEEIEEIEEIEESEGIKLGDTQAIAISAKALMNDTLMEEIPEKAPERVDPESPFDTGFIVQGRYDLAAQSEIGLKAGLTEEQKQLFSYFVPVHGMSEQIVDVLENDKKCKTRYGTSRTANLLIVGRKGSGKTVLAVDIVKAIQKARKLQQGRVGIVTAESLNKKDVANIMEKLHGGALIIEKASELSKNTIAQLNELMEEQTGELLVVLEEERRPLDKMLSAHPAFKKKFTSRLELPVFINDELVTFGQTYAKENGYKIDEMGILALYSRIDLLQREEKIVTVADVKELVDAAIEKSHKTTFKTFIKRLFKKKTDNTDRIVLNEEDFK